MNSIEIEELRTLTKRFIEQYYPLAKQQSDHIDQFFWQAWLSAKINLSPNTITKIVYNTADKILRGESTLDNEIEHLEKKYPGTATAWEQLIKVGVRVGWVQKIKSMFRELIKRSDITPAEAIRLYPPLTI